MTRPVNRMRAIHPGEVLREDFLIPAGISINALALALGVLILLNGWRVILGVMPLPGLLCRPVTT